MISEFKKNKLIHFLFFPIIALRRAYINYINRNIRNCKQLFSNVCEGSLVVTIKDIPGNFEVDARSHIMQRILLNKSYEPDIVSLIRQCIKTDRDAINIGANIGIFTILLAALIDNDHRVLAVEPTPLAFKNMKNNIERNKQNSKVILFNGVCVDMPGDYYLNIIEGKEEYSSIGESMYISSMPEKALKIKVKGESISNLSSQFNMNPGIILIDVEGAEMKVLAGATAILDKYKPIIISELVDDLLIKQESSSKEVIGFLTSLGYDVKDVKRNGKIKYPFTGNIIATPNHK